MANYEVKESVGNGKPVDAGNKTKITIVVHDVPKRDFTTNQDGTQTFTGSLSPKDVTRAVEISNYDALSKEQAQVQLDIAADTILEQETETAP